MFDTLQPRDMEDLKKNLEIGIEGVVDRLNKGSYDKITLSECAGEYLVATGNHRMVNLAVLYHAAMENPNLSDSEKQNIQNLELKVQVDHLAYDIDIQGSYGQRPLPSFLPELVEQEKQQELAKLNKLAAVAMNPIKEIMNEKEGFYEYFEKRFADAINDDPEYVASNIKDIVSIAANQVSDWGVDQETLKIGHSLFSSRNNTEYNIEQNQELLRDYHTAHNNNRNRLNQNLSILNTMPNPKKPKNWLQKLFDTKKKQEQRLAHSYQRERCALDEHSVTTVAASIAKLQKENVELLDKLEGLNKKYAAIQPSFEKNREIQRRNDDLASRLRKVRDETLPKLAESLGADYPYSKDAYGRRSIYKTYSSPRL